MKTKKAINGGAGAVSQPAEVVGEPAAGEVLKDDGAFHDEVNDKYTRASNAKLFGAMESISATLEKVKAKQNHRKK